MQRCILTPPHFIFPAVGFCPPGVLIDRLALGKQFVPASPARDCTESRHRSCPRPVGFLQPRSIVDAQGAGATVRFPLRCRRRTTGDLALASGMDGQSPLVVLSEPALSGFE